MCFDWSNAFYFGSVIAPTKNTHVYKLLFSEVKSFNCFSSIDFSDRFLLAVNVSEHNFSAKDEAVSVFGAHSPHFASATHMTALRFCLPRRLHNGNAHQSKHSHHILSFLLGDVGRTLLLFQSLHQIAHLFCLVPLFRGLLLYFSSPQQLPVFLDRRLTIKHPHRPQAMLYQQQGSIEQSQQMPRLIPFSISQRRQKVVLPYALGGHQKLVHRHRGIQSHHHSRIVMQISFLYALSCIRTQQIHQFVNSHLLIYPLYSQPIHHYHNILSIAENRDYRECVIIMQQQSKVSSGSVMWRTYDAKAQKNGSHSNIYWVKKQTLNEDGSQKANKWVGAHKYVGDWYDNQKNGFGIQHYANGNKYEGGWKDNKRHGQGTFWVADAKNKLRREYTGDWEHDSKQGRGTMFYKSGDRYDGMWMDGLPHGEGRMIFANGDVYEGLWCLGKRSGYGVMTKRCGDHFEGHWVNDLREGQGSYFFADKNKIFVGEWVQDTPKTGVYSEVEDPTSTKIQREKHFTDPYILPPFNHIGLANPTAVLEESIEKVRRNRTAHKAKFIPLDQLYTREQLREWEGQFQVAVNQNATITILSFLAILAKQNLKYQKDVLCKRIAQINPQFKEEEIDFEVFLRTMALILELKNYIQYEKEAITVQQEEDLAEQKNWYNYTKEP